MAKVEAYLLEQNTTEAYTAAVSDTETLNVSVENQTISVANGNGTSNILIGNETITIITGDNSTNVTFQNQSISVDAANSETEDTITPVPVQPLSPETLLISLNCSNAFVFPCPGVEEYPK